MTDNSIKGTTEVYGVIGCPIEHTLSPLIHNTFAAQKGRDMKYLPFLVQSENLGDAVKGAQALGIKGMNVTVPHKMDIMQYLCDIDKEAEAIGAVNTILLTENGYKGYNTDVIGVYYAIRNNGFDVKDKTVLLLGAGGAASACAVMAASRGAKKLYIANRTLQKAQDLADRVKKYYDTDVTAMPLDKTDEIESCDVVINSTVMGFGKYAGISAIADKNFFKAKSVEFLIDIVYSPWETKIMQDAKEMGVPVTNGFDMLVYQAVAAEEIWFDEKVSVEEQTKLCKTLTEVVKK
jgi:shikimate dehydrogenase